MTRLYTAIAAAGLAILGFLPASGQETIVLKNGSRLYGHTSKENVSDKILSFDIDSASLVLPTNEVRLELPQLIQISELPEAWKRWYATNPGKIISQNGKDYGRLANIRKYAGNAFYEGSAILEEQTDSTIRIFTTFTDLINIDKNKEIDHIEYKSRNPLALVGVIHEIETIDGQRFRGQIVEDRRKELVLLNDDDVRKVIPYSSIRLKRIIPFNAKRSLYEQLKYTSRIQSNKTTHEGIITETVYYPGGDEKPYHIMVDSEGFNGRKYYINDISEISYLKNFKFVEELDVIIKNDEILVNNTEILPIAYTQMPDRYEITDTTNVLKIKAFDLENNKTNSNYKNLKIHFKDLPINSEFTLVEAIPVQKTDSILDKNSKNKKEIAENNAKFYVNFNSLFNSYKSFETFTSPAGNIAVKYAISPGKAYLLIRKSETGQPGYLIIVE